ncbi:hypothetical protein ACWEWX_48770, partial [Streptomyces asiaticus]
MGRSAQDVARLAFFTTWLDAEPAATAVTAGIFACRSTVRTVSSRSGPGRHTASGAGLDVGRRVWPAGTTQ